MSLRIQHLTIDHDDCATALDCLRHFPSTDVTLDETYRVDLLSVIRHIMRERGDCTMIPVIRAAVRFAEVNEWGHNGEVEVTYHEKGYRAIYGVHFGVTVTKVDCYMD